jgi:oxygen-independent coproporphyrinogen-3 oxidase
MMWLPEQTVSEWLESIDAAIALGPEHLSLYMLEVYPNAPLKEDMARARWSQAPDDDVAAMYLAAMERLEEAGYGQYESSNVAKPGRQSRHNLRSYWMDGEWLGWLRRAPPAAASAGRTSRPRRSIDDQVGRGGSVAVDIRRLTPDEQLGDALFTGLRLVDGIDVNAIQTRWG